LSGFDTVLQEVRTRLSALIPASPVATDKPTFEMLETRQLLAANPLVNAGDYVIYDSTNADPQDVDIVALATGTTGLGATGISVNTSPADPDVIDLIINDPNGAAADNLVVNLVASGPINSITYNGSAGDTLVLNVVIDGITYTNGTTLVAGGTAAGFGFTIPAATDRTNAADLQGAIANGNALTADGNLGNVNVDLDTTVRGSILVNTAGNIGSVNYSGALDTSNAASTVVTVTPGANNTVTSFNVAGATRRLRQLHRPRHPQRHSRPEHPVGRCLQPRRCHLRQHRHVVGCRRLRPDHHPRRRRQLQRQRLVLRPGHPPGRRRP
jgi:hypothetical protein